MSDNLAGFWDTSKEQSSTFREACDGSTGARRRYLSARGWRVEKVEKVDLPAGGRYRLTCDGQYAGHFDSKPEAWDDAWALESSFQTRKESKSQP